MSSLNLSFTLRASCALASWSVDSTSRSFMRLPRDSAGASPVGAAGSAVLSFATAACEGLAGAAPFPSSPRAALHSTVPVWRPAACQPGLDQSTHSQASPTKVNQGRTWQGRLCGQPLLLLRGAQLRLLRSIPGLQEPPASGWSCSGAAKNQGHAAATNWRPHLAGASMWERMRCVSATHAPASHRSGTSVRLCMHAQISSVLLCIKHASCRPAGTWVAGRPGACNSAQ